jgi:hypothetical protein
MRETPTPAFVPPPTARLTFPLGEASYWVVVKPARAFIRHITEVQT